MKRVAYVLLLLYAMEMRITAEERPNILWIVAEDMSPDLACYGNPVVNTPHTDRLAAKGVTFTHAFSTGPACSPSRTALATGVYQTTLGAHHMRYASGQNPLLLEPVRILPALMRDQGYFTGNVQTPGTGKDDWMFRHTEKSWDTRSWEALVDHQPFFAQINMSEAHRGFRASGLSAEARAAIEIPPYYPDHPVTRSDWAGYLSAVNRADQRVGEILDRLKEDGLENNTIVVFLADHGRPMIRGKNWLYDSGTRVPLIVYYPEALGTAPKGLKAGGVNSALISLVDLVAETVALAGGEIPDWMQGRRLFGEHVRPRDSLYTAVDRIGEIDSCSRAVRTHQFKYIKNFKTPGSINACSTAYRKAQHPIYHLLNSLGKRDLLTPVQAQLLAPMAKEELYDLEQDPFETVNLIGDPRYTEVHQRLSENLTEWLRTSKDLGLGEDPPEMVEHFKQYGRDGARTQAANIEKRRLAVERAVTAALAQREEAE